MSVMPLQSRSPCAALEKIQSFPVLVVALGLTGCVHNRQYQQTPAAVFTSAYTAPTLPITDPKTSRESRKVPSVAVVEFRENGNPWTSCGMSNDISACQENFAKAFIRNAREDATTNSKSLVVLTFVHGWRHNASWGSSNFVNFQEIVDCMNWGESQYVKTYPLLFSNGPEKKVKKGHVSCSGIRANPGVEYAGIYIAWRGQSIKPDSVLFWASVTNREHAAERIVNVGELQKTLSHLGAVSKESISDAGGTGNVAPARFVVVGHSYGGLILNRAAKNLIEDSMVKDPSSCETGGPLGHGSFADLTVVINPADNSIRAAELMSSMRDKQQASPSFFCPSKGHTAAALPRPIILSIHTASDIWTGLLAVPAAKLFGYDKKYPNKLSLPDIGHSDKPPDFEVLRTYGINHAIYLHTLCYIDQSDNGDWMCDRINKLVYEAKEKAFADAGQKPGLGATDNNNLSRGAFELVMSVCGGTDHDPALAPACTPDLEASRKTLHESMLKRLQPYLAMPLTKDHLNPNNLLNLYMRLDVGCGVPNTTDTSDLRRPCTVYPDAQPKSDQRNQPSWDTTPYWTFNVPYHTIQGHSGFWNEEVVDIIRGISAAYPVVPAKQ